MIDICKYFHYIKKDENGNILILSAVLMVALLGMVALSVDVGNLYQNRREMVNAADASALAGAQELMATNTASEVEAYMESFAISNYSCDSKLIKSIANINDQSVWIEVGTTVNNYFAPIFNIDTTEVTSEAKAVIRVVSQVEGLRPIHITDKKFKELVENDVTNNNIVEFHKFRDDPGNWGWVHFEKNEGKTETWKFLQEGYPKPLPIGYGKVGTSTYKEFTSNTGNDTNSFGGYIKKNTIFYIPVSKYIENPSGNENLEIVGFAAIMITDFEPDGPKNTRISGHFLNNVLLDQPPSNIIGTEYDIRTINLTKVN